MPSVHKLYGTHVFVRAKEGKLKKLGKLGVAVFHPTKKRVVGYVVKRPDALLMFKRKELFVAADRLTSIDGGFLVEEGKDSWNEAACKRLDVDFDECVLWEGMPVKNEAGADMGTVSDVMYDARTLEVERIDVSADAVARKVLGAAEIEREQLVGFQDGAIVVSVANAQVEEAGGAAASAGEAWAKAKASASDAAGKAGKAVDKGAYKVGEAVGAVRKKAAQAAGSKDEGAQEGKAASKPKVDVDKAARSVGNQLGRASRMFKDFKDEFDKASKDG